MKAKLFPPPHNVTVIKEGITAPLGFLAAGVAAGIKKTGGMDMALIASTSPCQSAGTFTINQAKAAPVYDCLKKVGRRPIQGIVVNSGNANACTGNPGLRNSATTAKLAQDTLRRLGIGSAEFFVCSTGRIGIQLPMAKIGWGIRSAAKLLSRKNKAAESIMTTDTFPKEVSVEILVGGVLVRIGGIAKGAGMIQPGMSPSGRAPALHATMLSFITTDAVFARGQLQKALDKAVGQSFNRITVDGDMSTNDTVLLLANGQAKNKPLRVGSRDWSLFQAALNYVTLNLALMIVQDGEGISKVVTLHLKGAASARDAELAVRAVGNSILVKCSWCGEDPNWGRLCDAIGYSGARYDHSRFSLKYNGISLVEKGLQVSKNLKKIRKLVKNPAFSIACGLGLGKHETILYTTDLTEKYVELNKGE